MENNEIKYTVKNKNNDEIINVYFINDNLNKFSFNKENSFKELDFCDNKLKINKIILSKILTISNKNLKYLRLQLLNSGKNDQKIEIVNNKLFNNISSLFDDIFNYNYKDSLPIISGTKTILADEADQNCEQKAEMKFENNLFMSVKYFKDDNNYFKIHRIIKNINNTDLQTNLFGIQKICINGNKSNDTTKPLEIIDNIFKTLRKDGDFGLESVFVNGYIIANLHANGCDKFLTGVDNNNKEFKDLLLTFPYWTNQDDFLKTKDIDNINILKNNALIFENNNNNLCDNLLFILTTDNITEKFICAHSSIVAIDKDSKLFSIDTSLDHYNNLKFTDGIFDKLRNNFVYVNNENIQKINKYTQKENIYSCLGENCNIGNCAYLTKDIISNIIINNIKFNSNDLIKTVNNCFINFKEEYSIKIENIQNFIIDLKKENGEIDEQTDIKKLHGDITKDTEHNGFKRYLTNIVNLPEQERNEKILRVSNFFHNNKKERDNILDYILNNKDIYGLTMKNLDLLKNTSNSYKNLINIVEKTISNNIKKQKTKFIMVK